MTPDRPASPPLAGRRVVLRDWALHDLDPLRSWLQPDRAWHRLDGPYYPRPDPDLHVKRRRAAIERGDPSVPRESLAIADAETDELVGSVTRAWESRETHWPTLGIAVYDDGRWGRGLGWEALGLWSDYLFGALPEIVRLDLRTWSGNEAMIRLARKLGYREEARFRKARVVDGSYYDALGFGVLREEWEALYPAGFAARLRAERVG